MAAGPSDLTNRGHRRSRKRVALTPLRDVEAADDGAANAESRSCGEWSQSNAA
jgi:hypothetical protein